MAKEEVDGIGDDVLEKLADISDGSPRKCLVKLQQLIELPDDESCLRMLSKDVQFESSIKDLCEVFTKAQKKTWKDVAKLVKSLNESQEPETIRRAVIGWLPDVVVIDYADILAPMDGRQEKRYQVDETWKRMRGLSQKRRICVITATQADAASYRVKTLGKSNFSESKTKLAHANAFIGINALPDEVEKQIRRLNFIVRREEAYSELECLYVAGCLAIGNPMIIATLPNL